MPETIRSLTSDADLAEALETFFDANEVLVRLVELVARLQPGGTVELRRGRVADLDLWQRQLVLRAADKRVVLRMFEIASANHRDAWKIETDPGPR